MIYFEIPIEKPIKYIMTGKFKAPSTEWTHMRRQLLDYELIFMTEGMLYISINNVEYKLTKGDFLIFPPYCLQEGKDASDCSFYWLHFLEGSEPRKSRVVTVLPTKEDNKMYLPMYGKSNNFERSIIMMKQLQDTVRSYEDETLNNYLSTTILCEFYNQHYYNEKNSQEDYPRQQLYNDLIDYVRWHRNTNIKVIDIANHFGYNEKYLSHLFHSIKGMSLKQYILQEKIELAKFLLTDTNDNITIIAQQVGFSDNHNFMKFFKKYVGLTATEYRNAHEKRLLYYV